MRVLSIAMLAGVLLAGPALAASPMGQLKDIDGKVYVNRGKGFVQAQGPTELFRGDRVMVGEKGSASINYYLAECDVMLTASSMTTVSAKAPCKGGSGTSAEGLSASDGGGLGAGPFVVGAGLVTMGTLGVVVATGSDNNNNNDNGQSP